MILCKESIRFVAFWFCVLGLLPPREIHANIDFERDVAPILQKHCLSCHSGIDAKGGLDLSLRDTAQRGGDSGMAIVAGNLMESLLWTRIQTEEMPPKRPLPEPEKRTLKKWIESGATWTLERLSTFEFSTETRAGLDWWALQPLIHRNPSYGNLDGLIDHQLTGMGLQRNPPADKPTWLRRVYFDLIGLPPSANQLKSFLADRSPDAFERVVDELLASPQHGERWARHWLDVVRFGETNGFEYDEPRDNAWHYRNWVIQSLNQDIPYDEFVRMQIAGDAMFPEDGNAIAATGFLVAGPHNTTLPRGNEKMRISMAQDELEELVATVSQTFLGLTANCARCHDHKFDPISQKNYYEFAATLAGVKHGDVTVQVPIREEEKKRQESLLSRLDQLKTELARLEKPARNRTHRQDPVAPEPTMVWEFDNDFTESMTELPSKVTGNVELADGTAFFLGKDGFILSAPIMNTISERTLATWVQLGPLEQRGGGVFGIQSLDGSVFDSIVFGEQEPKRWMAGSNNFMRTRSFQGTDENNVLDKPVHIAIVYRSDGTIEAYRNGLMYGSPYRPGPIQTYQAGKAQFVFGLRHSPAQASKLLHGRIFRALFYDRALSREEIVSAAEPNEIEGISRKAILAELSEADQSTYLRTLESIQELREESNSWESRKTLSMYANVGTTPVTSRLYRRGDAGSPGEEVYPRGLEAVGLPTAQFQLDKNDSDRDRRLALARWITDSGNPLFPRVMVNRLWLYHFGEGFVKTPNDFGFNGGQPSHLELLDWLAIEFQKQDYRLKPLHRLLVLSDTYRQSSTMQPDAAKIDSDNRSHWRRPPKRLQAEEMRDAMLSIAGQLSLEVGGRGYRDVEHVKFKGSNFYSLLDESISTGYRRTIYRFYPRGGRNPFLDTFDCPDPSVITPKRSETITPLQALALLNNSLVLRLADDLAKLSSYQSPTDKSEQISWIHAAALCREMTAEEKRRALEFVEKHGLAAYCRVLFNSNEFVYVR